jgi:branched-chain amino acid aminotransferase
MGVIDRVDLDWSSLEFAYQKTDINIRYTCKNGEWDEGIETDSDTIPMHIAATCLHYGQEAFEGMKVYEAKDGRILGFRMEENAKRMQHSADLLMMKAPPVDIFKNAVKRVVKRNARFIPPYGSGSSLYVRPLLIGMTPRIGVRPAEDFMFMVLVTPVGPYFKAGFSATKIVIDSSIDRAAPQGVGTAKAGGNYAAGMRGSVRAKKAGFGEALYLDAKELKYIEELGAANFFGITKDNVYVTPKSPTILRSITNLSLRELAGHVGYRVEERQVPVGELADFVEVGACGTAAVISPIESIHYEGKDYVYLPDSTPGPHCTKLYKALTSIQSGDAPDTFGWTEEIEI